MKELPPRMKEKFVAAPLPLCATQPFTPGLASARSAFKLNCFTDS